MDTDIQEDLKRPYDDGLQLGQPCTGGRRVALLRWERVKYAELNAKQKEVYNFQKIAALLADYGFNCVRLSHDWKGADFLALHMPSDDVIRVQLKARLTVDRKYENKGLWIAFRLMKIGICLSTTNSGTWLGRERQRSEIRHGDKTAFFRGLPRRKRYSTVLSRTGLDHERHLPAFSTPCFARDSFAPHRHPHGQRGRD